MGAALLLRGHCAEHGQHHRPQRPGHGRRNRYDLLKPGVGPRLAETLAREVGAGTLAFNPIEGVTRDEQATGRDYVALMEENLKNLRVALDCR